MDFAQRLATAWPIKYRTQSEFAGAARISPQHLSGILRGKGVTPDTEERLAAALGLSRSQLIAPDDSTFLVALGLASVVPASSATVAPMPSAQSYLYEGGVLGPPCGPERSLQIEPLPASAEFVFVVDTISLSDTGTCIPRGSFLVLDRGRTPKQGGLCFAMKPDADASPPDVRLFRYHTFGDAWTLLSIDGSARSYGSGDGWVVVATVLWWRSAV